MTYEIQGGLAGFGVNEFPEYQLPQKPPAKKATVVVARPPTGGLTVARTPAKLAPTLVAVKAPQPVVTPSSVPPAAVPGVVASGNSGDPTAPPPEPPVMPQTVFIEPDQPAPNHAMLYGAGLLVGIGVAWFFLSRKA